MTEKEIKQVKEIRANYQPQEKGTSKLEQLKELNKKVSRPATIFAYIFGVIGTLILGTGMCLVMPEVISGMMWLGIAVGLVGILMVSINYPIYKAIVEKRKKKYSQEIISLSNELLNENN